MKKILVIFLVLCVSAVLILPSAAAGSVSAGLLHPYISIHISDDSDDNFEGFSFQYSLNNSAWKTVDTFDMIDLDDSGNFLYAIPQAVINLVENGAYVRYRCSAYTASSTVYSSAVIVLSVLPDELYITNLRFDGDYIFWDSNIYVYETDNNRFEVVVNYNGSQTVYYTTDRFFDVSQFYNSLGVFNGEITFRVRAFVRGSGYFSNKLDLSGIPELTIPVDTLVEDPDFNANVPGAIDALYHGVTHTPVYSYVFTGLLGCLPFAAAVFIINKFH